MIISNSPRKLVNIPKLMEHYGITDINVRYKSNDPQSYITIPVKFDLIVRLKVWIGYDIQLNQIDIGKNIIGVKNYWIDTLLDDLKNKRIDMNDYIYD